MATATLLRQRRPSLVASMMLALVIGLLPPTTDIALADSGGESSFVAAANRERAANGIASLSVAGDLTSVARSHSQVMANSRSLHHNPGLGGAVSGWQKVGENVGRGPSVDSIHAALMASPGHRRNILDPAWTQLGMGVVMDDGTVWVTQVFRTPTGAAPATPEPDPEPNPEADVETAPAPAEAPTPPAVTEPEATPEPTPTPAPAPAPEPEPRVVNETPISLDRLTLTLAKLEAAERVTTLADVLG